MDKTASDPLTPGTPGPAEPARGIDTSRRRYVDFLARWRDRPQALELARQQQRGTAPLVLDAERKRRYRHQYRDWLWPRRGGLILVAIMGLIGIGIDLIWPLVSIYLIDQVIMSDTMERAERIDALITIGGTMLAILVAASLLGFARTMRQMSLTAKLAFDLRHRLFDRVIRLPLNEVQDLKTGGVIARLSGDVDNTTGLVQSAILTPILAAIRLLFTLAIMFTLNWRIALAAVVVMPPVLWVHSRWIRRIRPIHRSMSGDRQDIDARLSETIGGLRVVRGFARETREGLSYSVGHHTVIRKQMLVARTQGTVGMVWGLMMPLSSVIILCFGGWLVINGQATIGILVAFQGYIWRLLEPVMQIVQSLTETQRGLAAMERVFDLLDRPMEKPDRVGAVAAPSQVHELRFEQVGFAYKEGYPVLHGIDLTIPGGSTVALVGPSGAGKTTLTDLVARFHDPSVGVVRLNGIDLRDIRLAAYRGMLGIVQQETVLFDGSVRDNIAFAKRDASDEAVIDAARRANAEEFIVNLPNGYQTTIGERGVKLSGGQRQRLAIARAILADPAILILDEATSNLDTESERLIQASMSELLKGRTTFVVAHRLSTITKADLIVVVEKGRVVEFGSHLELMARGGSYRTMVDLQRENPDETWDQTVVRSEQLSV